MGEKNLLKESYRKTKYQITGHGIRNVQVLKDALDQVDGEQESDLYGEGKVIEDFQEKMAEFLGKESAVFFPSGTMAQQIALRIWCDQKGINRVAYHPLCHLEIHEEEGLKKLHHIDSVLLADKNRVITLEDVVNMKEDVSCVLLELPQREIGGQLPDYETLVGISDFCRSKEIKLHLDGARLFEILPYYKKTAAEVCALFDSVYVSFYKGIGGVAGAILAGEKSFTNQSKVWKRRHGGDLISLNPYIISADTNFDERKDKMQKYFENAIELAELFNQCNRVKTIPEVPVSNMFHVHFDEPKERMDDLLAEIYRATNIGMTGNLRETGKNECFFEASTGDSYDSIPKDKLLELFSLLDERIKEMNFII
ncbi:threonine aldolase family protein [Fictibacillus nanhaiensis]|uniref:threonine aldolase family protein n=1 Tax=Fictibacillus nanhaiensis TaxID=742169 RepID=UPI001FECDD77|nr:beta-eliminating lyase-related protein [Fictibacillus nanhaiensis]